MDSFYLSQMSPSYSPTSPSYASTSTNYCPTSIDNNEQDGNVKPIKTSIKIDRSVIIDMKEEDLDEFTCGVCHEIFTDPMVTPCCRQTFCNSCITRWLKEKSFCPNDRKTLYKSSLTPAPRVVINLLSNMKVKCKYHTNGCEIVAKVSEMESHSKECLFTQCPTCGFGKESDKDHNCLQNLKIRLDSISIENRRLKIEIRRLEDQNKQLKAEKRESRSRSSTRNSKRDSIASNSSKVMSNPNLVMSETLKTFMSGKFKLVSKYSIEGSSRTEKTHFCDTIIDIKIEKNQFSFIRTGTYEFTKEFTLGKQFEWISDNGKYRFSVIDFNRNRLNLSGSRFVEIIYDQDRKFYHYYEFDILNKYLNIEFSVRTTRRVEIFKKIED